MRVAMSPRAYKADARRAASAETRAQILEAARSLLGMDGAITFSVDAIAASADVRIWRHKRSPNHETCRQQRKYGAVPGVRKVLT